MAGNNAPVYSKRGAITRSVILKLAANDYTGVHVNNQEVFAADATNGSFIQRLRFKPLGTNVATVARIFLNNGFSNENWATAPAAPTGTPSASGGTILSGTYYGMLVAIDAYGQQSVLGTLSTGIVVTGPTGSIAWSWTAVAGAVSYRLYVGNQNVVGTQDRYFTSATNSFSQTAMHYAGTYDDPQVGNCKFYGEVSLPATTVSATAALVDIDYPMNFALPPGWEVYAGLGTAVAAGWFVTPIAGDY
jgi:hypothetical protein